MGKTVGLTFGPDKKETAAQKKARLKAEAEAKAKAGAEDDAGETEKE